MQFAIEVIVGSWEDAGLMIREKHAIKPDEDPMFRHFRRHDEPFVAKEGFVPRSTRAGPDALWSSEKKRDMRAEKSS